LKIGITNRQQTELFQPGDDPNYIVLELRFESANAASKFR
jgi:hypothetical protein